MHIPQVSPTDVPDDAYLLDVREDNEWEAGHAPGAHHLPMMDVPARLDEIPLDGDVVVVCRAGGRSAQVTASLQGQGREALNVEGGVHGWAAVGGPIEA